MTTSANGALQHNRQARVRFRTETGSTYVIDPDALTWSRTPTLASGIIRTEGGQVTSVQIPGVGQRAVIVGPPVRPGSDLRVIITSPVVAIESDDQ
jgi:hypothetical protein